MLGAGIIGFATPFALGYALHVTRSGRSRVPGRIALGLAALETLACLVLAALWLRNYFA
jgi:hypothetical protein